MAGYRTSSFDDLLPEVLSEIASHLDFIDILSLQQTSKKLRESTEAHVVWLALARKYSAQHFRLSRTETGSFHDLKTGELRTWIRKRLVVDQIWRARGARPLVRTIHANEEVTALRLVPGTRWLLMGHKDGSVRYHDLDLDNVERDPLTPPSEGIGEDVKGLEIHVDEGASSLEFKLAVNLGGGFPGAGHFHMWQIKLGVDGNSLVAEPLNSIPYHFLFMSSPALGRHVLVCATYYPSFVEVIWWEQWSVTRDLRTRFTTGHRHIHEIHLIGDDKILCINHDGGVQLYTLPEPDHINGYMSDQPLPSRDPIWSYSLSGGRYNHSSPVYFNGTIYRLAVNVGDLIWGLVFPATKDDDPSVVKLSDIPQQWDRRFIGVCKAYAFHNSGTGGRIEYSWGDGDGIPTIRDFSEKPKDVMPFVPVFDEEMGRFVYFVDNNVVVIDYFP